MDCAKCESTPCTCQAVIPSTTPIRSTYSYIPPGITKEEFGVALFEAIQTQSAFQQCLRNAEMYRAKGKPRQAQDEEDMAKQFSTRVQTLLKHPSITDDDAKRVLAIR